MDWQNLQSVPRENKWASLAKTPKTNAWQDMYKSQNVGVGIAEQPQEANLMSRLNNYLGNTASNLVKGVVNIPKELSKQYIYNPETKKVLPTMQEPMFSPDVVNMNTKQLTDYFSDPKTIQKAGFMMGLTGNINATKMPGLKSVAKNTDSLNALKKFYGFDASDIPKEMTGDWKVIGEFVDKTGKKPYMSGSDWFYKNKGTVTKVPEEVTSSLENVRYKPEIINIPNLAK